MLFGATYLPLKALPPDEIYAKMTWLSIGLSDIFK